MRDGTVTVVAGLGSGCSRTVQELGKQAPSQWQIDARNGITRLKPRVWDRTTSSWVEIALPTGEEEEGDAFLGSGAAAHLALRIATYNVWFSRRNWRARARAVFRLLRGDGDPPFDVVALQEVTPRFLFLLREEAFVRRAYVLSDVLGTTFIGKPETAYGVLLLIKRDLVVGRAAAAAPPPFVLRSLAMHALPSQMARRVAVVVLDATAAAGASGPRCRRIAIATVHLESLGYRRVRVAQLEAIGRILDATDAGTALVCGDFNCAPDSDGDAAPPEEQASARAPAQRGASENETFAALGFFDLWPLLRGPGARGVTLPLPLGAAEALRGSGAGASAISTVEHHARIDRIILRRRDESGAVPLSIAMFGDVSVASVLGVGARGSDGAGDGAGDAAGELSGEEGGGRRSSKLPSSADAHCALALERPSDHLGLRAVLKWANRP